MVEVRGPWNLHKAIRDHWFAKGCDVKFKAAAGNVTGYYPTLDDMEQRPTPPGPYCVFEVSEESTESRSTGTTRETFKQHESSRVTFRIHAKDKTTCVNLAKEVAQAFDPKECMAIGGGDGIIRGRRVGSTGMREDDEQFVWIIMYEYLLDATYDLPPTEIGN